MSARSEMVRKRIIAVARDLFHKKGYSKTTMEDIAKALNKGKSSLYYYFRSKEDIFAALIESESEKMQNELLQVINKEADTKTLLRDYITARMQLSDNIAEYYRNISDEYLSVYTIIQKFRKSFDEFEIMALKRILLRGIETGEVRIRLKELDAVSYGIASAIKGLEIPFFVETRYTYFKTRLNILLDLLFYGILSERKN